MTSVGEDMKNKGTLLHSWWEYKLVQPLWKITWSFFKNVRIELPYDPVIALLGTDPKNAKTVIPKGTCTPMFIAALFSTVKWWEQPKCPSVDEWIKKNII